MKQIQALIVLVGFGLLLVGCGEATTDEPLPDGAAPRDLSGSGDADQPHPAADDRAAMVDDAPAPADTGADNNDNAERLSIPGMSYVLPEGWSVSPVPPSQFRNLTLLPPAEFHDAQLAVARFPNGVGDLQANVQRWAVNQLQMTADQVVAARQRFETITIDGKAAAWMPLSNPTTGGAILGIWAPRPNSPAGPNDTWTFKLTGTPEQIEALLPAVRAWAESVRFEDTQ